MNSFYSVLILASILSLSSAQSDALKDYLKKFDQAGDALCAKQITDDQVAELTTKCVNACPSKADDVKLIKTCLKVTDLTDRQFLTVFCDKPAKDCMVKTISDMGAQFKPDQIAARGKGLDTYIACVKGILK